MESNKPKSKAEQYKEKLKERELYSNNVLDRFTDNGGGAPLKNNDGSIVTKRRTMLNDDYEDLLLNQRNATPNPMNFNINQQQMNYKSRNNLNNNNNSNNNYMNNNLYQTLPLRNNIDLNNLYGINNNNNINNTINYNNNDINYNNNNNINYNNYNNVINNDNLNNDNFNRRPQSNNLNNTLNNTNRFYNNNNNINNINNNGIDQINNITNDPFGNNYQGPGILPRDRTSDEDRRSQNQSLRNIWLKEIKEKRVREAQKKQEQKQKEIRDEQRLQKEMEEQKAYERSEKLRKIRNEQNANEENNLLIENKRRNQNQEEKMVMNGNNVVPLQSQAPVDDYNPQIQEQNFRILRETYDNNNNINYNNNNNNGYQNINEYAFDSNPKELEENINEQIAKLRNDVNSQYIEMSNLFGKLKMDVIEANQLKNEAESELMYIKKELAKNKIASLAYDAQLNQVLERHAPYNNLHINIKDVDPLYSLRNTRKDLQSTSNMIYATDMVNEQNVNRVKQLSALAQAGQNLVGLKAESEFIPINNPGENNNEFNGNENNYGNDLNNDPKNNIAISNTGYKNLESESYPIFQQNNETFGKKEPIILDDYMNKGEYSNMYKQLEEIANINSTMGRGNQLKNTNKNFDVDYKAFNEKIKNQQVKNINQIDKLLQELS